MKTTAITFLKIIALLIPLMALSAPASAEDKGKGKGNDQYPPELHESQYKFWKKYIKQENTVAPGPDTPLNTDPQPDINQEGFVSLYNGKDLTGWTPLEGECTFEAQGDVIVGTCIPGSKSTYLSTDRNDYTDFIFTCEIKIEVDGNTGVQFRSRTREGKKSKVQVYGPQFEFEQVSRQRGWTGGIFGQSCGGYFYPLWHVAHEEARQADKDFEWNRVVIEAKGSTVKTWINGVPASIWETDEYMSGFFSLQVHKGDQGKILFRDIRVKEL